jgi:hypothetical protein
MQRLVTAWSYQDMHEYDELLRLCISLRIEMLECERLTLPDPNQPQSS